MKAFKAFIKPFWGTTQTCENTNLSSFLLQYNFLKCTKQEGLTSVTLLSYFQTGNKQHYKNSFRFILKPNKSFVLVFLFLLILSKRSPVNLLSDKYLVLIPLVGKIQFHWGSRLECNSKWSMKMFSKLYIAK